MLSRIVSLLVFAVLAVAMDLKELTEKVDRIQNSPLVVISLIYDSDKSMCF